MAVVTKQQNIYLSNSPGTVQMYPIPGSGHAPDVLAAGPAFSAEPSSFLRTRASYIQTDDDPLRKREYKPVNHYKMTCYLTGVGDVRKYWWLNSTINAIGKWSGKASPYSIAPTIPSYTEPPGDVYQLYDPQPNGDICPPPPGLQSFIDKSLRHMMPGVKSQLSLINSIIELKDFKSVGRSLSNAKYIYSTFKVGATKVKLYSAAFLKKESVLARLRRTFSPSHGPTLAEVTHTAADGYLQAKFNILPLLSDISGVKTALDTVRPQVDKLLTGEGKVHTSHFTDWWSNPSLGYDIADSFYAPNQYPAYVSNGSGTRFAVYGGSEEVYKVIRKVDVHRAVFRAHMKYKYSFDRWQREYALFYGLMDSLGWNLNPTILWNAIPWSFTIDWLIGVNRWLDDRKVLNLQPQVNILNYMWSCKRGRTVLSGLQSYQSLPTGHEPSLVQLPDVNETLFQRGVDIPKLSWLVSSSGLSATEFSLGAALAITRKKPRKRRV